MRHAARLGRPPAREGNSRLDPHPESMPVPHCPRRAPADRCPKKKYDYGLRLQSRELLWENNLQIPSTNIFPPFCQRATTRRLPNPRLRIPLESVLAPPPLD